MVGPTIDNRIIYGFDDGELREYTLEDVKEMVDEECVAVLVGDATEGLCDGERGSAAAAGFTYVKGYPDDKAVGVLLGRVEDTLFGADVYSEHHVCLEKFAGDRTLTAHRAVVRHRRGHHNRTDWACIRSVTVIISRINTWRRGNLTKLLGYTALCTNRR